MKKRISLSILLLSIFAFFGLNACNFGVNTDLNTPQKKGDTDSIVVNEIFTDENGEEWVTITMNASNSLIKDSRTIMPDKPKLWFSVVGSTEFKDANGDTAFQETEDADCTKATAETSGVVVIDPFYATTQNTTTGIRLTLKVGHSYYLTAYGTSRQPKVISDGTDGGTALWSNEDHTHDNIFGDMSTGSLQSYTTAQKTHTKIALAGTATNMETYYKYREVLVDALKEDAVVRGTAHIYVGVNATGGIEFRKDDSSGAILKSISIPTSSKGIDGIGYPVIIVDLPATEGGSEGDASLDLERSKRSINSLEVRWTPRTSSGVAGSFVYDLSSSPWKTAGKLLEFRPAVAVGEYDLDVTFFSSTKSEVLAGTKNDVFALHDTLIVWKNQKSKILGTSSFYSPAPVDTSSSAAVFVADTTDETKALVADSVQALTTGSAYSDLSDDEHSCKAYVFTAEDVRDFQRTVFYVSGTGNKLPAGDDINGNGSLFAPYATVQRAMDDIVAQRAAGYDKANTTNGITTDWNIVLDGAEKTPTAVSFSNDDAQYTGVTLPDGTTSTTPQATAAVAEGMNLTIRAFKPTIARATLSENFTFNNANNAGSDTLSGATLTLEPGVVRLYLVNFDWNGSASDKTFTIGTDCYLKNSSICSDLTTPAVGTGKVHLKTAVTDTYGNGVFYVDTDDTTSTVMGIYVDDDNTTKSGGYGHNVVSYLYHDVNDDTVSVGDYTTVKVSDPEYVASAGNAPNVRFAVDGSGDDSPAAASAGADFYNSDKGDEGAPVVGGAVNGIKKVLGVDTEVGSATYGCVIVQVKDISVTTPFSAGNYRGTISMTPVTIAASTITSAPATRTLTGSLTVITEDPTDYPADSASVKAALGHETNNESTGGDFTPSNGSMIIYFAESEDANRDVTATDNPWITATYIDGIPANLSVTQTMDSPAAGQASATYQFAIELNELIADAPSVYYLRVYFEIGEDDSPSPFSETFRITIN